ncbi:hypothetical protein SAMN04487944_11622 [Gracilibacillus ureilyticus]|uniref:Uncharacterized protein n=1 Tax=Gracilibacillus ureilyticus TaxID=531814 RepID=A0A1H9U535_9BACI|nr:hypothetical protein [Gracilibacillus ureilyticus]SES04605.1 hypothetical protein SAMN04487944_11622 [Gracilibacillus ureilyticus]
MSEKEEEILEEISGFLHGYLKSGNVRINSFLSKTNVNISNLQQLLTIRFLLLKETKTFVQRLPFLLKHFKTTTATCTETNIGEVRGEIDWAETTKHRLARNHKDRTIFSTNESVRSYDTPENLVLKELLGILYRLLFQDSYLKGFEKAAWFTEWQELKSNIEYACKHNIYLQRVHSAHVSDRTVQKTQNHRNRLYREAAQLLVSYRKIIKGQYNEEDLKILLRETFIAPENQDVLFELYWIIQIIKQNTEKSQLHLMDGGQNKVATWEDDSHIHHLYHDSSGSDSVIFHIPTSDIEGSGHAYLKQKVQSLDATKDLAQRIFGRNVTSHLWRGRPDFLIESYDQITNKLTKLTIGEVKNTSRVEYATTGLEELVEYLYLVKDRKGRYLLNSDVTVQGMLCLDQVEFDNGSFGMVKVLSRSNRRSHL